MSDEDAATALPHVVLVCFPTQGHVNPTLRLAKRLASKGLLATFCTTSGAGAKLAAASPPAAVSSSGVRVGRGRLRFEFLNDDGNEREDLMRYLATSAPAAFAEMLHRHAAAGRPVACVVGNPFLPWVVDVAAHAGVPEAVLWPQSCAVFSVYYHFAHGLVELPPENADDRGDARVCVPGLPPLSIAEVPSFLLPSNPFKLLTEAILNQFRNIEKASWVFVNSFSEFEGSVLSALPGVSPRPPELIPVGPLIELDDDDDLIKPADDDCIGWLDKQPPRSVVYVAVGSIVLLTADEVAEMAYGLESTGRPFLWVVRPETRPLLPEGFMDDDDVVAGGGRGVVVPWSPQERVLAHAATACFLTHCGWNSTLETVAAGVPVVAFPQWGDQCTDAKFLVEELGMGVRLRAPPLRRETVREAVEEAVAGEDADAMLARARSWSAAARAAVGPGGSSERHVQAFVHGERQVAKRLLCV